MWIHSVVSRCIEKLSHLLILALAILLSGTGLCGSIQAASPNFLVIIADDLGWGDLGCYGHPRIKTPHLDEMARRGLVFQHAFLTCSSCSPSRCSIMTGRYPHSTGAGELHLPLPGEQVVFAGLLKDAGYYTASAGKWHLGKEAEKNFDRIYPGGNASGCGNWMRALRERPDDKPFFMWLAAVDPHRGYKKNTITTPHQTEDAIVPPFLPDTLQVREDLAMYYDEVARLDNYIGTVMRELEEQGIAENTLVIFLSDNGRPFPRCKTTLYDSGIRTPFIAVWPEKIIAGQTCYKLVSSLDIAPTLLELAEVPKSPTFQGVSFAGLLANPQDNRGTREFVFAEHNWHDYQARERAVRSNRFLYIKNDLPRLPGTPPADAVRSPTYETMQQMLADKALDKNQVGCFTTPRPSEELYDTLRDPYQLRNLAYDPAYASVRQRMREELEAWSIRTNDVKSESITPDGFDRVTGKRLINAAHPSQVSN